MWIRKKRYRETRVKIVDFPGLVYVCFVIIWIGLTSESKTPHGKCLFLWASTLRLQAADYTVEIRGKIIFKIHGLHLSQKLLRTWVCDKTDISHKNRTRWQHQYNDSSPTNTSARAPQRASHVGIAIVVVCVLENIYICCFFSLASGGFLQ